MTPDAKREWNRAYYLQNREKRLAQQKAYWRDYKSKGLKKPRKRQPRSIRDHERYIEHRDEILVKQKLYRDTHKDEIKARRRKRVIDNIKNYYARRE